VLAKDENVSCFPVHFFTIHTQVHLVARPALFCDTSTQPLTFNKDDNPIRN
jgi:hypothetical protein